MNAAAAALAARPTPELDFADLGALARSSYFFVLVDTHRAVKAKLNAACELACELGDEGLELAAVVADRTADKLEADLARLDAEIRAVWDLK